MQMGIKPIWQLVGMPQFAHRECRSICFLYVFNIVSDAFPHAGACHCCRKSSAVDFSMNYVFRYCNIQTRMVDRLKRNFRMDQAG